jgi:glutamate racemase
LRKLPNEALLYFGDTVHLPFGPRPAAEVREFSLAITSYLIGQGAKLVIIACNTATVAGLAACQAAFPDTPILGMIEPGAAAALAASRRRSVAVVGTKGTIDSGEAERALLTRDPHVQIVARENEALLRLAEQGGGDDPALLRRLVEESIPPALAAGADALLLACTDYACIRAAVDVVVPPGVTVIDPAEAVVDETARLLAERGLRREEAAKPRHRFCLSSLTAVPQFRACGETFLGITIDELDEVDPHATYRARAASLAARS